MFAGLGRRGDPTAGNGDAPLHERSNLLGLGQCRDDPPLHLGSSQLTRLDLSLSEHEGRGEVSQKRPLVGRTTAEHSALATMTHDKFLF